MSEQADHIKIDREKFDQLMKFANDIIFDKSKNTLGDWVRDYGGGGAEAGRVEFGSWLALAKMLDRRDKEVVRNILNQLAGV